MKVQHFRPALRGLPCTMMQAVGMMPEPLYKMGSSAYDIMGWATACVMPNSLSPFKTHQRQPSERERGYIPVDIKLLRDKEGLRQQMDGSLSLQQCKEQIEQQMVVPATRLSLIVVEERCRDSTGVGRLAKHAARNWQARQPPHQTLLSWLEFVLLPEAINRELDGRGLVGWMQTMVRERLHELEQGEVLDTLTIQVELLSGKTLLLDADCETSLADGQSLVEQATAVPMHLQRWLISEKPLPSKLDKMTTSLLLGSLGGVKAARSMVQYSKGALSQLVFGKPRSYCISVTTPDRPPLQLQVTGDMTIDQVHDLVASSVGAGESGEGADMPEMTVCRLNDRPARAQRRLASPTKPKRQEY
ncbi:hypothetical protein WJX72_009186 [[Myrmecia] bisecta]|uniref:Uncharacterized protein n=1 Tax=[Myrmecia] bisecta TaxID=41462 RepID=A0AAW1QT08_9CHLO